MVLRKEIIPIDFGQGVDTKTTSEKVVPGRLTMLKNGRMKQGFSIDKRYGYASLSTTAFSRDNNDASNVTLPDGVNLSENRDELLLVTRSADEANGRFRGNEDLYSLTSSASKWSNEGGIASVHTETRRIDGSQTATAEPVNHSCAMQGNILCLVNEIATAPALIEIHLYDTDTGLVFDKRTITSATDPKVVAFNSKFYVLYNTASTNDIRILEVETTGIDAATPTLLVNNFSSKYAVINTGTRVVLAYNTTTTSITLNQYDTTIMSTTPTNTASIGEAGAFGIGLAAESDAVTVVFANSNTRSQSFDNTLTSVAAAFTVDGSITPTAISAYRESGSILVIFADKATPASNTVTRQAVISTSAVTTASSVLVRSVYPVSEIFTDSNTSPTDKYIVVLHQSELQPTYFILSLTEFSYLPAGQVLQRSAGLLGNFANTASVAGSGTGSIFLFCPERSRAVAQPSSTVSYIYGSTLARMDFDSIYKYESSVVDGNTIYSGSVPFHYDSNAATEYGFLLFPEGVSLAESAGGSLTALGTYQYVAVYEWVGVDGKVYRSAPSVPETITLTSSNQTVTATVPTLRLTTKTENANLPAPGDVGIVLYRTENNGTLFYRVSGFPGATNSVTTDSVNIGDTTSDANLISSEPLYTRGGILPNFYPAGVKVIAEFNERLWVAGDFSGLYYSKKFVPGSPPEFSESLFLSTSKLRRRITGLIPMDDKLIVFTNAGIGYTFGDGPNPTGIGGRFADLIEITTDVGCVTPKSLTRMPNGILFKSQRGWYQLNRNLSVSYVGAAVEYWNDLTVNSTELLEEEHEVRILCEDSSATHFGNKYSLVYNYLFQQWWTNTNFSGRSATNWKGRYTRLDSSHDPVVEDSSVFRDGTTEYALEVGTGWISPAGIQGFARIYRLILLLKYYSDHQLQVRLQYNYRPDTENTYILDPTQADVNITPASSWGPALYEGEVLIAQPDIYQFRIHMPVQKLESFRVELEDINRSSDYQSYALVGMALEVGLKTGVFKKKPEQTL